MGEGTVIGEETDDPFDLLSIRIIIIEEHEKRMQKKKTKKCKG